VDIVIVGGGIIGTMHAFLAVRAGHRVVQIEREDEARGASVRNFGLVWISGRAPGAELELALRARELWDEVGAAVPGVSLRANGSLTIARSDAEAAVLAQVCDRDCADDRGFALLDPGAARAVNPALRGRFTAALHCTRDAVVEPRVAAKAIRAALSEGDGYRWLPGREVVDYGDRHVVDDHGVTHRGDLVVLATGAWHRGLLGPHLGGAGTVRRCRLQMMQTEPLDEPLTTSVADGDSLRYYPAFATPALQRLPAQLPVPAAYHMQLLMVQRLDGSLTIGDTHAYVEPFDFDLPEQPYQHLVSVAEVILGRPLPPIRRRWAGVYSQLQPDVPGRRDPLSGGPISSGLYHRSWPAPGVVLVTGPGGRGMTLSPAIAEETLSLAEVSR
jgi:FAD dependent oxidoreductase TIGR03364